MPRKILAASRPKVNFRIFVDHGQTGGRILIQNGRIVSDVRRAAGVSRLVRF